jgi:hypothetical protein
MSEIVNWGHWFVAAAFAMKGIVFSYHFVLDLIHGKRGSNQISSSDYLVGVVCVVYLLCSWGLLKWRHWSLAIAITLSVVEIFFVAIAVHSTLPVWLDRDTVLWGVVTFMIVAWLLIPRVRAQFRQRMQAA